MARLIDLGEDNHNDSNATHDPLASNDGSRVLDLRPDDPNIGLLSGALVCYPIAITLAQYLDLTSLHELSRTCRRVRAALLQYQSHLIAKTLRCANEQKGPAVRLGNALQASFDSWTSYGHTGIKAGRITSGKLSVCARDMVAACRRCNLDVCRNCTVKPPLPTLLRSRHRRLCRTCMKAPIETLTSWPSVPTNPPLMSTDSFVAQSDLFRPSTRTMSWTRSPCTCEDSVWICHTCGHAMITADTTYARGWAWRTRYSACGGIGAGLGEGNEGVECGGGMSCLAAHPVEHEIECDDIDDAFDHAWTPLSPSNDGRDLTSGGVHDWSGSSYTTHEMVGIGGRVKRKLRQVVAVGAAVVEYEDERATSKFLAREQDGTNRSWCSWCARVVLSRKDRATALLDSTEPINASQTLIVLDK